ncbi:MAG: DEAD/DEAH box helicase, partial [Chloroflexi bacterium]|nr:DEAD/DEAH box helicase [Chloroflexota bacterium]
MDPITLARQVEDRYQRYLKTMFYFRDPVLRESFAQALAAGHLGKGPFLEATPIFKKGDTPRALFTRLLGSAPEQGFINALEGDRPLHKHQHRAIERVAQGHNVIVATGTGSGKTEAFLYPILLHLYREHQAGKLGAGVRALVLYPMNALANDQRDRLGKISKKLESANSPFKFTFGQYIGETPEGTKNARLRSSNFTGELKTRAEIRETPPHILLTNYSMLEYLLIRPNDSSLFDNGQARWWTFLVLDEAHLYRGARGIEMGMLIRRLKQRLREGGCAGKFRCIATSATLVSEEKDKHAVAKFASDLFGELFTEDNVILGETDEIPAMPNERATQLCRLITGNPLRVQDIADQVFNDLPTDQRLRELTNLVQQLTQTKHATTDLPTLSARYHLFLRSLEGAYIQFLPAKRILLEKNLADPSAALFEIALCRECGQHYLVAQKGCKDGQVVVEANRDPSHDQFGASFLRPIENAEDAIEEDGNADTDTQPNEKEIYQLCVRCGKIAKDKPRCGHSDLLRVVKEESNSDDKADQIKRCGACGYNAAGRDPVREITHGTDGPHSVIATTLYQNLEPGRKKILAFADGRQEAAFFAWYLDKSYHDILNRNLFLRIARSFQDFPAGGIALADIADRAIEKFRDSFGETSDSDPTRRKNIWHALYREFLTDEQRISLEGVGLVRWSIEFPKWFTVPPILRQPPWSLTEPQARDLILILLNTMRTSYAVELKCKGDVTLGWQDLISDRAQKRFCIGSPAKQKDVVSWNGAQGGRTRLLEKIAQVDKLQIDRTLREIWQALTPEQDTPLLDRIDGARRLNPNWWRLHLIGEAATIFECSVCGQVQSISVCGICARRGCPGKLNPRLRRELELDHYRALYEDNLPGSLVVEEHTAQLDHDKAREFQQRFKDNKINVLSCSTTFELGVDLGDLDTAFLRNVPPESFNYAQRVGRVGRRLGRPGFVVTFCKRNSHDL